MICNLFDSKFMSDSGNDQVRVANGRQRDEADAVVKVVEQGGRDFEPQVSFADATRACCFGTLLSPGVCPMIYC